MNIKINFKTLIIFFLIISGQLYAQEKPTGLLCNLLTRPELTLITTPQPQFGWIVNSEIQTAYQILVASSVEKLELNENIRFFPSVNSIFFSSTSSVRDL